MNVGEGLLLAGAGLGAGAVNAIAGGGSLLTFPALLATGLHPVTANVTNSVALWPSYASGTVTLRPELRGQGPRLRKLSWPTLIGGAVGATLLLTLPGRVFRQIVPWLLFVASGLLAVQPRLVRHLGRTGAHDDERPPPALHAALFLAAVYGAYFGGGLGVILLAVLGLAIPDLLHRTNVLKNALSLLINTVAVVAFLSFGPVAWGPLLVLMPTAVVGAAVGARLARRVPPGALRIVVVVIGTTVGVVLLVT